MGRRSALAGLVVTVAAFLLAPAATGQDAGPAYTDWNPEQVGFPSNAPPSSRANCVDGSDQCIDRTIGEMYRRFHDVVPFCDDNNVFSLTYLRVTEDIRAGIHEGFYPDKHWINYLDAIFARTYFLGYDNYMAGRIDLVPPAWRIAFDAGRNESVKGIGNLLLSMNAHINRDFPFVLYQAGVTRNNGSSRKDEHDSGNQRLRALYKPMITELTERFDESIDDYDIPGSEADDEALFSILVDWRETAWQNALRLAAAKDDAERRQVGQSIEEYAVNTARAIYAGSAYGPGESDALRDSRCKLNGGQDKGYRRGSDVAGFGSRKASLPEGRDFIFKVRCPDGPGPCIGEAFVRGTRESTRFDVPAGKTRSVSLLMPGNRFAGDRVRVKLRSDLRPGVEVTKRRKLRVRAAG